VKWLADENIQDEIVEQLRVAGEDVVTVAALALSAADPIVVAEAQARGWLLLTADRDFGELVVRQGMQVPGVVLLRLHGLPVAERADVLLTAIDRLRDRLPGSFTVIHRERVRIRPLHR
jgi:predicted nuclease of predicted toxin-antitoxin system